MAASSQAGYQKSFFAGSTALEVLYVDIRNFVKVDPGAGVTQSTLSDALNFLRCLAFKQFKTSLAFVLCNNRRFLFRTSSRVWAIELVCRIGSVSAGDW
jgi:hypothetical protein